MRLRLDQGKCRGFGICVGMSPEQFDMPHGSPTALLLDDSVADEREARDIVSSCPAGAISLVAD